ncbi:MAG: hypothetical protein ACREQN_03060 [Candidatus Binataceae bacterium]
MPSTGIEMSRFCSQCGNPVVVADASFCKDCGAALQSTTWFRHNITWRPWVALALSIVPGLGQIYKGHRWRALAWFFGVMICYGLAQPLGIIMHIICACNAALAGAIREESLSRESSDRRSLPATAGSRPWQT